MSTFSHFICLLLQLYLNLRCFFCSIPSIFLFPFAFLHFLSASHFSLFFAFLFAFPLAFPYAVYSFCFPFHSLGIFECIHFPFPFSWQFLILFVSLIRCSSYCILPAEFPFAFVYVSYSISLLSTFSFASLKWKIQKAKFPLAFSLEFLITFRIAFFIVFRLYPFLCMRDPFLLSLCSDHNPFPLALRRRWSAD